MQTTSKLLALVALGGAMTLAACGGSPDISPVAATTAGSGDDAVFTSSGYGPGPANGGGAGNGYGPGDGLCGDACTGPVGPDPADIGAMLALTLQEEYRAENLYRGVLLQFGDDTMPFGVIADSEARHVEALLMLFARRPPLQPPPPPTAQRSTFASIPEACAAGVAAEITDADFYTPYLLRDDLPQDVRNVFTNLQAASLYNHLPAFERCR